MSRLKDWYTYIKLAYLLRAERGLILMLPQSVYFTIRVRRIVARLCREFQVPKIYTAAYAQKNLQGIILPKDANNTIFVRHGVFIQFDKIRKDGMPSQMPTVVIAIFNRGQDFLETVSHEFAHYLDHIHDVKYSDTPGEPDYSPFAHDRFRFDMRVGYIQDKLKELV